MLYSDQQEHDDALKRGFLVIVSGEKGKGELEPFLTLGPDDLRLTGQGQGIEYRKAGQWKAVDHNSYAIFSLESTDLRGEDNGSPWYSKFLEGERAAKEIKKASTDDERKKVQERADQFLSDAGVLLTADNNYIEPEREKIVKTHEDNVLAILKQKGDPKDYGLFEAKVPKDAAKVAGEYRKQSAALAGGLAVTVKDTAGDPASNMWVYVAPLDRALKPTVLKTDANGQAKVEGLLPGTYTVKAGARSATVVVETGYVASTKVGDEQS